MAADEDYGARFLAELRCLGVGAGNWNYKTVTAIESADRERFVALLKQASPHATGEVRQLALTEGPEALARKLIETQRADDLLVGILLSL
jgi:hypothetical protein